MHDKAAIVTPYFTRSGNRKWKVVDPFGNTSNYTPYGGDSQDDQLRQAVHEHLKKFWRDRGYSMRMPIEIYGGFVIPIELY